MLIFQLLSGKIETLLLTYTSVLSAILFDGSEVLPEVMVPVEIWAQGLFKPSQAVISV